MSEPNFNTPTLPFTIDVPPRLNYQQGQRDYGDNAVFRSFKELYQAKGNVVPGLEPAWTKANTKTRVAPIFFAYHDIPSDALQWLVDQADSETKKRYNEISKWCSADIAKDFQKKMVGVGDRKTFWEKPTYHAKFVSGTVQVHNYEATMSNVARQQAILSITPDNETPEMQTARLQRWTEHEKHFLHLKNRLLDHARQMYNRRDTSEVSHRDRIDLYIKKIEAWQPDNKQYDSLSQIRQIQKLYHEFNDGEVVVFWTSHWNVDQAFSFYEPLFKEVAIGQMFHELKAGKVMLMRFIAGCHGMWEHVLSRRFAIKEMQESDEDKSDDVQILSENIQAAYQAVRDAVPDELNLTLDEIFIPTSRSRSSRERNGKPQRRFRELPVPNWVPAMRRHSDDM